MKVVSTGGRIPDDKNDFEFMYVFPAWIPQSNGRMKYGLVGTNNEDDWNKSPVLEAFLIPYTGKVEGPFGIVYYFKYGYLHNDDGPAILSDGKETTAKDGFFLVEGEETGEKWAMSVLAASMENK